MLEPDAKGADIIVEARAGALSIDSSDSLIGIPNTGLPIPLAGTVSIPELAFYKAEKQFAYAKIALLAFANQSRTHIFSSGPLAGNSYNKYHKLLFVSLGVLGHSRKTDEAGAGGQIPILVSTIRFGEYAIAGFGDKSASGKCARDQPADSRNKQRDEFGGTIVNGRRRAFPPKFIAGAFY